MFSIHIHHHYPELEDLSRRIDTLTEAVCATRRMDVAVFQSVHGLSKQLDDIANSSGDFASLKAAIKEKAQELNRSSDALASAVTAADKALHGVAPSSE